MIRWTLMVLTCLLMVSPVMAQPPNPPVDECAEALEQIDDYGAVLAAAFLSLNQLEHEASVLNAQLADDIAALALEEQLLKILQARGASTQELIDQLHAINAAKAKIKATRAAITAKQAQIDGTKALIDQTAAARAALQDWYDEHCAGTDPNPVPVPDPNF